MITRTGSAVWNGGIKDGNGSVSTESGGSSALPYSFGKRFGDEKGSNPEELVGAAHAACYSMQLSGVLGGEGMTPARRHLRGRQRQHGRVGFTITKVHLTVKARSRGRRRRRSPRRCTEGAKEICPISELIEQLGRYHARRSVLG